MEFRGGKILSYLCDTTISVRPSPKNRQKQTGIEEGTSGRNSVDRSSALRFRKKKLYLE